MEGVPAPENGLGSVIGVVMEEWPTSSHLVDKGFDPYSFSWMLIIFSPDRQSNLVPFGHDDAGGPDLHVKLVDLSGRERLFRVMGMIGAVLDAEYRIQFTVRSPEPSLSNGGVRIQGALEDYLVSIRSKNAKDDEKVRVSRRRRYEQLRCERPGDFRFLIQGRAHEGDAVAKGFVFDAALGIDRFRAEAAVGGMEIEPGPPGSGQRPLILPPLNKTVKSPDLELHARLGLPVVVEAFQKMIKESLLQGDSIPRIEFGPVFQPVDLKPFLL
jgi:hypothetical protein